MNYPRNNPIYLKQVYRFQSNQIKFENPKSLQPLKKFIVVLLKTLNLKSQIKARLSHLANSYFYNYKPSPRILRQHRILRNLSKSKDIIIWKPDKGNEVVILDRKLYDNATQEIISDTSKFEKLNYYPTLKREASLRFLRKLKQKNIFNENEYDKLYPSGSAEIHKFSSSDSFPKIRAIVSSIGTFNYNVARFLYDLF